MQLAGLILLSAKFTEGGWEGQMWEREGGGKPLEVQVVTVSGGT